MRSVMMRLTMAAALMTTLGSVSAQAAPKADPKAQVESNYAAIKAAAAAAADEESLRPKVTEILDKMVDWNAFSDKTMTTSIWEAFTPAQKETFISAYKQLIIKKYAKRFKPKSEFTVELRGATTIKDDKSEAIVRTTVFTFDDGKKVGVDVDYHFVPVDGGKRWGTADIVTDGVSRARTYRPKFKRIFARSGFDALIKAILKNVTRKDKDKDADDD